MNEHADRRLVETLAAVTAALDSLGAAAMIVGGIAVIAHDVPRQNHRRGRDGVGRERPVRPAGLAGVKARVVAPGDLVELR